ncbi:MAG: hypothetical protein ACT4P2_16515 [Pseudomonadota bacterium]
MDGPHSFAQDAFVSVAATKPPEHGPDDEALQILRRIEPVLVKIDDRLRKVETELAELKGRVAGIEGELRQIPTPWQTAALVFAIFGAAFVVLRFGLPPLSGPAAAVAAVSSSVRASDAALASGIPRLDVLAVLVYILHNAIGAACRAALAAEKFSSSARPTAGCSRAGPAAIIT